MIEIKNLTKKFKKNFAVKDLSLKIEKGEVFGFLGPNGAGKTTTLKMILNLMRPDKGEIKIFNKPHHDYLIKKQIGFLPEHTYFYKYLTGNEFLHLMGELFEIPKDKREKKIKQLLKKVGLSEKDSKKPIKSYSKGMQQRIGLAQALINDPEIIFLDEPMSGLDPVGRREVKDIILDLKKKGKTVFFNSHILSDAEILCDRVGIINQGSLILCNSVEKITKKGKISLEDVFVKNIIKK